MQAIASSESGTPPLAERSGPSGRVVRRLEGGVIGCFDEGRHWVLVGPMASEPARVAGALTEWLASLASGPLELMIDWRGLDGLSPGAELEALHRALAAMFEVLRGRLVRLVAVTPDDWSRLWWHGVHAIAELDCPWLLVHDLASACRWLRWPDGLEHELSALGTRRRTVSSHVEALLMTRLEADTEVVARLLSMSPRSLQRALELEGKTFSALRDRLRLARAHESLRRGDKVEAIAGEVGFASTSHFVRWFRTRSGLTPSEFRRLPATGG